MQYACVVVALEGLDGVGKSTTAEVLKHQLLGLGFTAVTHHYEADFFPEAFIKERQRPDPNVKYFLQLAAATCMANHLAAYPAEVIAICDRYVDSATAYFSALPPEARRSPPVHVELPPPRHSVLLQCTTETRLQRLYNRAKPPSKRKLNTLTEFGQRLFTNLAVMRRWDRIDNERLSPDETAAKVVEIIEPSLRAMRNIG